MWSVYIGTGTTPIATYAIQKGKSVLPRFGTADASVRVKSTNGVPIFTSQRAAFGNSFNELMGYPADQLTTEYWFTFYDDIYMSTWLMIGNPDPVRTANVEVYIGTGTTPIATYAIQKGKSVLPRFGIAEQDRRAGEEHQRRADLHQPAGSLWEQLQRVDGLSCQPTDHRVLVSPTTTTSTWPPADDGCSIEPVMIFDFCRFRRRFQAKLLVSVLVRKGLNNSILGLQGNFAPDIGVISSQTALITPRRFCSTDP
ncbi:MAG: hypothetical protein M0C28_29315 [Candidatus Moduliflexus flocculans]|nr:hypothetical protein [Candidatus Moduliflexus flocculans]